VGSIVASNKLWRGGDHYHWLFFQITKITETGRIMALQLEKKGVPDHLGNVWPIGFLPTTFDCLKRYVAPIAGKYVGCAKMLAFGLYDVYDAPSPMDSSFYDGGCRD
jgi:hypothetical protein